MSDRKSQNKNHKDLKISKKKQEAPDEDDEEDLDLKDDNEIDDMLVEEMHGELNEEDDEEFIHQVKEFEKEHSKSKIINIFSRIGKPKFREASKLDSAVVKEELKRLILLLDKYNIIVHFHNDYSDREKYRFITEEVFREFAEYDKKNHITILYEDYHPEMDEDDDDEEF